MSRWAKGLGVAIVGVPLVAFIIFVAWSRWRSTNLLNFCKELRAGMTVKQMFALEAKHSVDTSFLYPESVDQARTFGFDFANAPIDPDFVCSVGHDGQTVRSVKLIP